MERVSPRKFASAFADTFCPITRNTVAFMCGAKWPSKKRCSARQARARMLAAAWTAPSLVCGIAQRSGCRALRTMVQLSIGLAQLRKQDLRRIGEHWVITITPEAGTVKTNEAREVVLHPHLAELGFPEFVAKAPAGHLFLKPAKDGDVRGPLRGLKNRLAAFAREVVPDPNVAPNHGWRHRFKTIGMEAGVAPRVLDAIQGQAPRSVADSYGDVTVKTMAEAIGRLPRVEVR